MGCPTRPAKLCLAGGLLGDRSAQVPSADSAGKPAAFIETDLVDPRYFSAANVKNRLESYFQMVEQKRAGARAA